MERWKDIDGWIGFYQVSDLGRVRSIDRLASGRYGPTFFKGRVLKAGVTKKGYLVVALSCAGQKPVTRHVHELVLEAFVGPAPEGHECCHGPLGGEISALSNLRWDTRQANADDRSRDHHDLREYGFLTRQK